MTKAKPRSPRARMTHEEIVALIDRVEAALRNPESGAHTTSESSIIKEGTRSEYSIHRLLRQRPDIIERLRSGEIRSVNAAVVEAGIHERFVSIPSRDAERAARTILKQARPEVAAEIARRIMEQLGGTS